MPLELKNHLFVLPATINGHAIEMLLDTGAHKSLLGESAVQRLNLIRDARSYTSLMGLSGSSATPDARIDSMSIGAVVLTVQIGTKIVEGFELMLAASPGIWRSHRRVRGRTYLTPNRIRFRSSILALLP